MSFAVMTDSSANLEPAHLQEHDLQIIPFSYYTDGQEHNILKDGRFHADEFYNRIRRGLKVTTSQINPQQYIDFFEPCLKAGKDILFVAMSSGISGSCASARLAARELCEKYRGRSIEIVDSLGASLGEGLLVLRAAKLRDLGIGICDAAAQIRQHAKKMFQVFTVDDLMHLRRGGRLSNLSAVVGTVLQLKPLLKGNEEGKIVAFSKIRGRKRSIEALAEEYERYVIDPQNQIVGIAQAGCREDAERLEQLISRCHPPRQILTVEYEPVTGSHVGPGALALFFEGGENVRSME